MERSLDRGELCEWGYNGAKVADESSIKIGKA